MATHEGTAIEVKRRFVSRDGSGVRAVVSRNGRDQIEFKSYQHWGSEGLQGLGPLEMSTWSWNCDTAEQVADAFEMFDATRRLYEQLGHERLHRTTVQYGGKDTVLAVWAMSPHDAREQALANAADMSDEDRAPLQGAAWVEAE